MLIIHFIGLAMGIGTSFGFMFLGIASSKMEKKEAQKFTLNSFALSKMGYIGITLLVISGVFLMAPFWEVLSTAPLLIAKLFMVLVLIGLVYTINVYANKAKKGDTDTYLKKIPPVGRIALLFGVSIVILAVYMFH